MSPTRYERILSSLRSGVPMDILARKYRTDVDTIKVYQKVIDGTLSEGSFVWSADEALNHGSTRNHMSDKEKSAIIADYNSGVSRSALTDKYNRAYETVRRVISDAQKIGLISRTEKRNIEKPRKKKKRARHAAA